MAQQAKFSINIKPRRQGEQFVGTGLVNFPYYLAWVEEAVVAYWEKLGIPPETPNIITGPVKIEMILQTPLRVEEEVKLYARVRRIGRSSLVGEYQINEAKTERSIASITFVAVRMDTKTGRSVPIPEQVKQKIIAFEGKENVEVA